MHRFVFFCLVLPAVVLALYWGLDADPGSLGLQESDTTVPTDAEQKRQDDPRQPRHREPSAKSKDQLGHRKPAGDLERAPPPALPVPPPRNTAVEAFPRAHPRDRETEVADAEEPVDAESTATLGKEEILLAVKESGPALRRCYQDALDVGRATEGTLKVKFTLVAGDGEGQIDAAEILGAGLGRPFFEMCILKALGETRFPVPEGDGKLTVTYPFRFAAGR